MNRSPDVPAVASVKADSSDSLLRFRPEFPILEKSTYLISNSLGAMPKAAAGALAEYADTWATRGVRAWADSWWDMSAEVGVGIRLSPHFYTQDEELFRAFAAIDEIRTSGAWRRWRDLPAVVT